MRSGLGSSSFFTLGLLNTLYALRGRIRTKATLAAEATRIEQEVIGESERNHGLRAERR
jgi:D-glycero-alpha-D-manno-heptose-7-phosphate kinase